MWSTHTHTNPYGLTKGFIPLFPSLCLPAQIRYTIEIYWASDCILDSSPYELDSLSIPFDAKCIICNVYEPPSVLLQQRHDDRSAPNFYNL